MEADAKTPTHWPPRPPECAVVCTQWPNDVKRCLWPLTKAVARSRGDCIWDGKRDAFWKAHGELKKEKP